MSEFSRRCSIWELISALKLKEKFGKLILELSVYLWTRKFPTPMDPSRHCWQVQSSDLVGGTVLMWGSGFLLEKKVNHPIIKLKMILPAIWVEIKVAVGGVRRGAEQVQLAIIIGSHKQGAGLVRRCEEGVSLDAWVTWIDPLGELQTLDPSILYMQDFLSILEDSCATIRMPVNDRKLSTKSEWWSINLVESDQFNLCTNGLSTKIK